MTVSCTRRTARAIGLLATLWVLSPGLAQPTVDVELGPGFGDKPNVIAHVVDDEGQPVTRRSVEFYLLPDFFPNEDKRLHGTRPVYLGSGTTDTTGTARTGYTPPFSGPARFEARLLDEEGGTQATGSLEEEISRTTNPAPPSISKPLASVRFPLGYAILGLVTGLWVFLIGLTVTTIRTLRRLGKEA